MRILTVGNMYPPHHLGGYELVWQAAVQDLRSGGHDVRVLTTDYRIPTAPPAEDPDVHRELRWYWQDHAFPRLRWRERLALERHNRSVFDRHLREHRPDLLSWWAMGGLSLSLLRRANTPAIGWVNDDWLAYAPEVDQWLRPFAQRRARLANAARWVFCSQALERSMRSVLPAMRESAAELQGVSEVFERHEPDPWQERLVYVGRLDRRKGIATAIQALAQLPDATLRIVGDGDPDEAQRLRALTRELRLDERVRFDGALPRTELPEIYAQADATVFPVEWFEPFGLVPLESMAVGRPVVATGQGGSGDYLRHGENALIFERGNPSSLAQAVSALRDDQLRAKLVEGGLATASQLTERRWLTAVRREHEQLARH